MLGLRLALVLSVGLAALTGCKTDSPSDAPPSKSVPAVRKAPALPAPAEPTGGTAQTSPSTEGAPPKVPNDAPGDDPPMFDRVTKVVETRGHRTKCNDLNGCPLVNTLVSMGPEAAPAMMAVYGRTRGDDHWRLRVLEALGRLRHPDVPDFLLRVGKSDPLQPMRVQAILSLARHGDPALRERVSQLESQYHPQKHRAEYLAVGFALAALGDREAGEAMIRKHFVLPPVPQNYRRWDLLRPGVYAIGQLRMKDLRPQIEDLSVRADPFVRRESVRALAAMRERAAIPAIAARLNDDVPGVRTAAVKALQTLTGLYNNKTPKQWRRWWAREVERGTRGQSKNIRGRFAPRTDGNGTPSATRDGARRKPGAATDTKGAKASSGSKAVDN